MTEAATLISNLGFPIACVVALAIYIWKTETAQTEQLKELKDSITELRKTVEAMSQIFDQIKGVIIDAGKQQSD